MSIRHLVPAALAAFLTAVPTLAQQQLEKPGRQADSAFAIVVDVATWKAIPDAIRAYKQAVEADGLATWILADDWQRPEVVRAVLSGLHDAKPPLEGAILIGRIPVPMFRGAQHLTTAFKMDERRYPRNRSSVPSDRFYEDFDLVGESLGQDEDNPLLHYYQLAPESAQRIEKEIYTARVFPPLDGGDAHAAIAACLKRFVRKKEKPQQLDRALTLLGHGYVSESLDAWADTRQALGEQIPALRLPGGALVELHHGRGAALEGILLRELADPAFDLAVLHSHGDDDRQFLTGAPELPSAKMQIEAVQRYLRSRLRRARTRGESEEEAKQKLMERLSVPADWFDKAFDDAVTSADEDFDALSELVAGEVDTIAPGAEVVHLDTCFNGNFVVRPYQAAAYLFGNGETVAVVANSVNIAQDVWADRYLGLLAQGQRVGAWHRRRPHLESHLFGDPTFRFAPGAEGDVALKQLLVASSDDDEFLVSTLLKDPSSVVRLEALAMLARRRGPAFGDALPRAAADPSEIVRRRAVSLMGDVGRDEYLAPMLRCLLRDPSQRVVFETREALKKFDPASVEKALGPVLAELPMPVADRAALLRSVQTSAFIGEYQDKAKDRSLPADKRVGAIRSFRLYRVHAAIGDLIALATAADDEPVVRQAALEALGWFVFAAQRGAIVDAARKIAGDAKVPSQIREEAVKTVRRIGAGANDSLLP